MRRSLIGSVFNWKRKYTGLLPDEMRRLNQMEDENLRLGYGYHRMHVLLRWAIWRINRKKIYRFYRELGMQLRNKWPKTPGES